MNIEMRMTGVTRDGLRGGAQGLLSWTVGMGMLVARIKLQWERQSLGYMSWEAK